MTVITRRNLLGAAAVVVAGGAGVTAGVLQRPHRRERTAPRLLVDALRREQVLAAGVAAAIAADPSRRATLGPLLKDHEAHRDALQALVDQQSWPRRRSSEVLPPVPDLLAATRANQASAATASASSAGSLAALLASISACEAGHVVLLS